MARKYVHRHIKGDDSDRSKTRSKGGEIVSHPETIHLSKDCILTWPQFLKALESANRAYNTIIKAPDKAMLEQLWKYKQPDNSRPQYHENNNTPPP
jgi:hypothetical protein